MKLFFAFILGSFFYGLLAKHPRWKKYLFIAGFGLIACFAYFFLHMI